MKTCIVIEDQPPAQRILIKYVKDINIFELKGVFSSAIGAIEFLSSNKIDLIFLDIHLPKMSGMEFLKTLDKSTKVILTTAFSRYALESYEFNVVDYLLKPFSFERFSQAVNKSEMISMDSDNEKIFYIKSGYNLIHVKEKDILYIKSDKDYTEIYTAEKKYLNNDTLKKWKEELSDKFCQIHKSYILNTQKIKKIKGNRVYINDEDDLPIGRAFKDTFMSSYIQA